MKPKKVHGEINYEIYIQIHVKIRDHLRENLQLIEGKINFSDPMEVVMLKIYHSAAEQFRNDLKNLHEAR